MASLGLGVFGAYQCRIGLQNLSDYGLVWGKSFS